jgi:hypothetical protein
MQIVKKGYTMKRLWQKTVLLLLLSFPLVAESYSDSYTPKGIEVNPLRLFTYSDEYKSFSGAFSLFLDEQNAEVRFPLYWGKEDKNGVTQSLTTVDAEYRYYYEGINMESFYVGGLGRVANLSTNQNDLSTTRFGLGMLLGYRYFTHNDFYFGSSISVVRYLSGESEIFNNDAVGYDFFLEDDGDIAVTIDFINIGYKF